MPLSIVRTIDATSEPLSRTEAKEHLRIDDSNSDALVDSLIVTARQTWERLLGRQFLTATWTLNLDCFPSQYFTGAYLPGNAIFQSEGSAIYVDPRYVYQSKQILRMPVPPLQSVASIAYIDSSGVQQTWGSSNYIVDTASEPGRISPAFGQVWPVTQARINAVTITFNAGWTALTIPAAVKHLLRLIVGDFYENRVPLGSDDLSSYSETIQRLAGSIDWGDYK